MGAGAMPALAAALVAASLIALIVWGLKRSESTALLGAGWFVLPLLPYLALPDHKMDYYLAVPAIGIALSGAYAMGRVRKFGALGRLAIVLVILVYTGTSVQASWTVTRWQHAHAEKVEDLVLGVEEIHQAAKGKIILLDGIDSDLFFSGVADLPFRAKSIPGVYLAPGSEVRIQAAPDLLSKYVLPQAIARRALSENRLVVYRFDGQMLHNETAHAGALWTDDEPASSTSATPFLATTWAPVGRMPPTVTATLDRAGTIRIAAPRGSSENLYIGVFETRDFLPRVRIKASRHRWRWRGAITISRNFASRFPPEASQWKQMEVAIENPIHAPLLFGYAEVR